MDARVRTPTENDAQIGELFGQLVNDGRNLVRAEADLYKKIALYRVGKAKAGAVALVVGGLLAYAGLIAFMVGLVFGLANLVGPVAAGAIVLVATCIISFLLIRFGASKLAALGGDADERAALAAGEHGL